MSPHPSPSALEPLLLLIYPPVQVGVPEDKRSLAADLDLAKKYCRARLAHELADLDLAHCEQLLMRQRTDVHRLVEECIEYEEAGYPLTIVTIAQRIRTLACNGSASPSFL